MEFRGPSLKCESLAGEEAAAAAAKRAVSAAISARFRPNLGDENKTVP